MVKMTRQNKDIIKINSRGFLRHVLAERTWCLIPVTIMSVEVQFVILRISCGTEWFAACDEYGKRIRLGEMDDWSLSRCKWNTNDLTYLIPTDAWYAFGLLSDPVSRIPKHAYVNFQKPLQITPWGYDTLDLELDLTARFQTNNDFEWILKDEIRFHELGERGIFTQYEVTQVQNASTIAKNQYKLFKDELKQSAQIHIPPPPLDHLLRNIELPSDVEKCC